jgi:GT2 family glycosyltransferase
MKISAVISTWNKREAVLANIAALKAGSRAPDEIVVVDNASRDGTAAAIREQHPEVVLVEMPHDRKGACETFNIGFWKATGDLIAIMDDDVRATADWLATLEAALAAEPASTAMASSRVIEPGMPESYQQSEVERGRYYASTFRGCGTLARAAVLRETGGYDERFFIYGNERDLAARVLGRGHRILQLPEAVIHHDTPFGMKAGPRSLYYHVRNFWLYAFKNCRWSDIGRVTWSMARRARGSGGGGGGDRVHERATGSAHERELEATGTMGLSRAMRETPGAWWIVTRATLAALANLPYCLSRRAVVRAPDFRLPGL